MTKVKTTAQTVHRLCRRIDADGGGRAVRVSTYVLMKVLESAPSRYDRGIRLLTLGSFDALCFSGPKGETLSPETIRKFKLNLMGHRMADEQADQGG